MYVTPLHVYIGWLGCCILIAFRMKGNFSKLFFHYWPFSFEFPIEWEMRKLKSISNTRKSFLIEIFHKKLARKNCRRISILSYSHCHKLLHILNLQRRRRSPYYDKFFAYINNWQWLSVRGTTIPVNFALSVSRLWASKSLYYVKDINTFIFYYL